MRAWAAPPPSRACAPAGGRRGSDTKTRVRQMSWLPPRTPPRRLPPRRLPPKRREAPKGRRRRRRPKDASEPAERVAAGDRRRRRSRPRPPRRRPSSRRRRRTMPCPCRRLARPPRPPRNRWRRRRPGSRRRRGRVGGGDARGTVHASRHPPAADDGKRPGSGWSSAPASRARRRLPGRSQERRRRRAGGDSDAYSKSAVDYESTRYIFFNVFRLNRPWRPPRKSTENAVSASCTPSPPESPQVHTRRGVSAALRAAGRWRRRPTPRGARASRARPPSSRRHRRGRLGRRHGHRLLRALPVPAQGPGVYPNVPPAPPPPRRPRSARSRAPRRPVRGSRPGRDVGGHSRGARGSAPAAGLLRRPRRARSSPDLAPRAAGPPRRSAAAAARVRGVLAAVGFDLVTVARLDPLAQVEMSLRLLG